MNFEYYKYLCYSLAKTTGTLVRLYKNKTLVYSYSVYPMDPDPILPFQEELLAAPHKAGICATPLYQLFGYFSLPEDYLFILGPTQIINKDKGLMEKLFILLDIPSEKKKEYELLLLCAPYITAERMSWMISYLVSSATKEIFPVEEVFIDTKTKDFYPEIQTAYLQHSILSMEDDTSMVLGNNSYNMELLLLSYIEAGQPEALAEFFSSKPSITEGTMAQDSLRQKKNAGICCATIASRAAISAGMDSKTAFCLSDLYIQKFELVKDIPSAEKLINELMLDYAKRVQQHKFNTKKDSILFQKCAAYVAQNIYSRIHTDELAEKIGYSRTYLCNQFKKQTGISLTQYILQEKIIEAQRMLQFTDKSLSEIASQFSFTSQSHFQTVFKKITGETPLSFRQKVKKN